MKLFVYKSLFVGFLIFVIFHLTFGYVIKTYEAKIQNSLNADKLNYFKDKLRSEIQDGLNKDRILNKEDSILIKNFITKIRKELDDTN
tara:strand:+ start:306 stop:569 length:264 start_codon:yes stop_codon:yes gene_type:complete